MGRRESLNGGKTRPLSNHAREKLRQIARQPVASAHLNYGVVDRLTREPNPLCRTVQLPSPFQSHRGRNCDHLEITNAGRRELGLPEVDEPPATCPGLVMSMSGGPSSPCVREHGHDGACSEVRRRRQSP